MFFGAFCCGSKRALFFSLGRARCLLLLSVAFTCSRKLILPLEQGYVPSFTGFFSVFTRKMSSVFSFLFDIADLDQGYVRFLRFYSHIVFRFFDLTCSISRILLLNQDYRYFTESCILALIYRADSFFPPPTLTFFPPVLLARANRIFHLVSSLIISHAGSSSLPNHGAATSLPPHRAMTQRSLPMTPAAAAGGGGRSRRRRRKQESGVTSHTSRRLL